MILLCKFDRTVLQDLSAESRKFEHFVVGNDVEFFRVLYFSRIGGVNAVDVGIYLTEIGFENSRKSYCRGVRPSASESRYVVVFVYALETRYYNDVSAVEFL